jgi:hypothetical protein
MNIKAKISMGELIDKITILKIKAATMEDEAKLKNVKRELRELQHTLDDTGLEVDLEYLTEKLHSENRNIWVTEDMIRKKEAAQEFDEEFIELARNVYFRNDERARIKREINERTSSNIVEEKEYVSY